MSGAHRKPPMDAAESETLCMHENSLYGNRETLETPSPRGAGRSEKAYRRTSDMHVSRESDGPIVPKKRANKAGPPAAETVEGRGSIKGNAAQQAVDRTQRRSTTSIGLWGVRQAASRDRRNASVP